MVGRNKNCLVGEETFENIVCYLFFCLTDFSLVVSICIVYDPSCAQAVAARLSWEWGNIMVEKCSSQMLCLESTNSARLWVRFQFTLLNHTVWCVSIDFVHISPFTE
jgi:hypothetical protein